LEIDFVKKFSLLFLLIANTSFGQLPFFRTIFLKEKKEPIEVNVILQDSNGYLLIGTTDGLFKLDGHTTVLLLKTDSLRDGVTALAEDKTGKIWCGHKNGRITIIDKQNSTFFSPPEGLPTLPISDMLFDKSGVLWFSTLNDGIYYFLNERLYRLDDVEGLPDLFVYDLEEDIDGAIWAGTDGGIAICTRKDKVVSVKVLNSTDGLPDNIVRKIKIDDLGSAWVGTDDAGLVRYEKSSKTFIKIFELWGHGTISDLELEGDQLWMTLPQAGLLKYNHTRSTSEFYNSESAIQLASLKTILLDKQKNLWVGSKTGLQITRGDLIEKTDLKEKLKEQAVLAIAVDKNKTTWFSTKEGLFTLRKDASGNVKIEKKVVSSIPSKATIISMYADPFGNIWAGLYGEGVLLIDTKTNKASLFFSELRNGNVLNISGSGDQVWIATLEGATRFLYSKGKWELKNYSRANGLASDYIYQVFIDSQGRVWFATDRQGINMLDVKGFYHYKEGLESKAILGFAEDAEHQIWANVQGEGLYKWKGNQFQVFEQQHMLRDRNINTLCADNAGNLVMAHNEGIDIYDVHANKFISLGEEYGLEDFEPTLNSLATDETGTISFGTEKGIIKYSAKKDLNSTVAIPHIIGFRQLGKSNLSYDSSFSYNQNDLVVDFAGFWYVAPDDVCFQYMLEGYDKDWINSRDRSATYSSLPPGKFTFHLRASNSEECNGVVEATYKIEVSPPFWRTAWFFTLASIAFIFGANFWVQYRERKLIKEKKILEQRVADRTKELQLKAEEIQAQNEEIQSQSEEISVINENLESLVLNRTIELERKNAALADYAFINAHKLRAPVASILGLIGLIKRTELGQEGKVIVDHLEDSAAKLDEVVGSITKAIEQAD
jgi:ligand-binding sensor domain-containing protein